METNSFQICSCGLSSIENIDEDFCKECEICEICANELNQCYTCFNNYCYECIQKCPGCHNNICYNCSSHFIKNCYVCRKKHCLQNDCCLECE